MVYLKTEQVLIPRQLYIGDSAEIHCTFETDSASIRNEIAQKGKIELSKDFFKTDLDLSKYDIKSVIVESGSYNNYSLIVSLTAWHTGKIQIPNFDIGLACGTEADVYVVNFTPVEVVSIVQTESISTVRDMHPPLLLPGTTYKIYAALISAIILIILIIRVIIKRKSILFYLKNRILLIKYSKNKKSTFRALIRIKQNNKMEDSEVSTIIQNIMRAYLEFRFDYPFTKKVSSEIMNGFNEATKGLMSEKKLSASEDITQVFIRTDYIRYSKEANFMRGEKEQLISRLMNAIDILETVENETPEEIIDNIIEKKDIQGEENA